MIVSNERIGLPKRLISNSRGLDYAVLSIMILAFVTSNALWWISGHSTDIATYFIAAITVSVIFFTIALPLIRSTPTTVSFPKHVKISDKIRFHETNSGNTRVIDLVFFQYIIISKKDLRRNASERDAILCHEYAHLYYNDAKLFQLTTVMFFSMLIQICIVIVGSLIRDYKNDVVSIATKEQAYFLIALVSIFLPLAYFYREILHNRELNADHFSSRLAGDAIFDVLKKIEKRNELEKLSSFYNSPKRLILRFISNSIHPTPKRRIGFHVSAWRLCVKNAAEAGSIFVICITMFFFIYVFISMVSLSTKKIPLNNGSNITVLYTIVFFTMSVGMSYISIVIQTLAQKKRIEYVVYFLLSLALTFVLYAGILSTIGGLLKSNDSDINDSTNIQIFLFFLTTLLPICIITYLVHWIIHKVTGAWIQSIILNFLIGISSLVAVAVVSLIYKGTI